MNANIYWKPNENFNAEKKMRTKQMDFQMYTSSTV